jgi:hypothetical protein
MGPQDHAATQGQNRRDANQGNEGVLDLDDGVAIELDGQLELRRDGKVISRFAIDHVSYPTSYFDSPDWQTRIRGEDRILSSSVPFEARI